MNEKSPLLPHEKEVSEQDQTRFDTRVMETLIGNFRDIESKAHEKEMFERAKKEYNNKNYNHYEWFFGSKEKKIPRWTGYALGFNLVAEYPR